MWGIVLLLGLSTAPDPVRIGIALFLISRPRPLMNLVAYWLGGMVAGVAFAVAALVVLRDVWPVVVHNVTSTAASVTGGHTKIVVGVIALLIAAVNVVSLVRERAQIPAGSGGPPALVSRPTASNAVSRLLARVLRVLEDGRPWIAFLAGLGQATPWVEYLAALSVIAASGAAIGAQLCAAVLFTAAIFVGVEIPLVLYLVRPRQTEAIMVIVHDWLRAHRRQIISVAAGVLGILLLTSGLASI